MISDLDLQQFFDEKNSRTEAPEQSLGSDVTSNTPPGERIMHPILAVLLLTLFAILITWLTACLLRAGMESGRANARRTDQLHTRASQEALSTPRDDKIIQEFFVENLRPFTKILSSKHITSHHSHSSHKRRVDSLNESLTPTKSFVQTGGRAIPLTILSGDICMNINGERSSRTPMEEFEGTDGAEHILRRANILDSPHNVVGEDFKIQLDYSPDQNDYVSKSVTGHDDVESGMLILAEEADSVVSDDTNSQGIDSTESMEEGFGDEAGVVVLPSPGVACTDCESTVPPFTMISLREVPNMCAICLCPFEVEDKVSWSSNHRCQHIFHYDCILSWLTKTAQRHYKRRQRQGEGERGVVINATHASDGTTTDFPVHCPTCRQDFVQINSAGREGSHEDNMTDTATDTDETIAVLSFYPDAATRSSIHGSTHSSLAEC